jgi:TolB-like protein/class 3 adenylate cyclase/Tfp pilus assembly protein PilF
MTLSDPECFKIAERLERRLTAILIADAVGFARLMHHDEESTLADLTTLLTDVIVPAVTGHGGRIVKTIGDGFLAEFPSAVDAVRAAMQFQRHIHQSATGDAEDSRLLFRVGINVGDVIVAAHDLFGDGVNIAARLESIAEPGGICISSSAFEHVRGKVAAEFIDLGEQNLKNIGRPVRTYALAWNESGMVAPASVSATRPFSVPHLSIVVLPFVNIGGDPAQDYFVDGITESLITDLSRIQGSFVIARNTAFAYQSKSPDVRLIGHELKVRYVLEGSVQCGGNRFRVNVQLIDAETGNHLWAERFDKPIADIFDMQDEIVSRLANTLDSQLVEAEAQRASCLPYRDSMDLYFQGRACWNKGLTPEDMAQAKGFFERALALDPRNIDAEVALAIVVATFAGSFVTDDRAAHLAAAETAVIHALSMEPRHPMAHLALGVVYMFTNRAAQGIRECERALALDRNLADAHGCIGMAKYFVGRPKETEAHIDAALRLSPRDVFAYRWSLFVGIAKLQLGDDAEAVVWLRRSIEANRNFPLAHFHLAEALALLGQLKAARAAARAGLALDPGFNLHRYRVNALSDNPSYLAGRERSCAGMRLAGVPET